MTPPGLSDNSVQSLHLDREGVLWVGTLTMGLNRLDPETGRCMRYLHDPAEPASLSHNSVSSIREDSAGRLWVGTQGGGLNLLNRTTGRFSHFRNDPYDPDSLGSDSVMSILEDSSGMLWFGTFGAGADTYDPFRSKFLLVQPEPGNPNSLAGSGVWSILEDNQGDLWVGSNGAGLSRFDARAGRWRRYQNDPADPRSLSDNTVYVVYQDRQGTLWLGTATGLVRFDAATGSFQRYGAPSVMAIYEDSRGDLWVGSVLGLFLFDRDTGASRYLQNDPQDPSSLSANAVSLILEDARGRLWVGTPNGGLNLLDRDTERCTRFVKDPAGTTGISSNTILAMYQAGDGTLWLGTGGGLDRFDPQSGTFAVYSEKDGLANNYVYGILEDDEGCLWLSTNKGLSRFDPRRETFKNYDISDGLQASEFNQWAFFKNKEGVMYFGGIRGLNAFHPSQIVDSPFVPPVVITGLRIYNQPVTPGPDSPLERPLEASTSIQLSYADAFLEFEYAALHFSSPGEIRYAYMMEGLDKAWNEVGNRRFASYTNMPPGEYTFRVKASNADGVWNEQGAALRIVIPPPFWQTTWFRLLVAAVVIGAVSGGFLLRIQAIERQRRHLEHLVEERTSDLRSAVVELERAKEAAEAASRAKSIFLANMSHEFRTPLNAILGFTQIMAYDRRLAADQREDIAIVQRSSEHLLGLINDVLEMSKIEAGRSKLSRRCFDLHHMLAGLDEMFALRARSRGISLELALDPAVPRYVWGDEGKLRQVLMNLIGNAVKFTAQGGVILSVDAQETLHFAVVDNGPGIAPEELSQLFVPFAQTGSGRQAQEGTGLGLAISQQFVHLMGGEIRVTSKVGRGSEFRFELPLEPASADDLEAPPPSRRVIGLEPGQPTYRMLIVDDREVNRKLLVRVLAPLGFELREASNGQEALQTWEAWQPHLIWMDMRMPVMDGYEATRRIKATTRGMGTIIVALTASALEEDRAVILSEGCDDYMRKPFRTDELYAAIARHLGVRFAYEAQPPAAGVGSALARDVQAVELAGRLRAADPAWLEALQRAATLGDVQSLERLAGEAGARDAVLAAELSRLARAYDHERILEAIRRAYDGGTYGRS